MHWLQYLSQINADSIKSERYETSRHFRNITVSEWYSELQTDSKNRTIWSWQTCSKVWQPRNNLISVLIWDFVQHRLVVCYRHFRTTCQSYLQGVSSPMKLQKQITTLHCRIPEEHRSHLHCVGSLKSCTEVSW